MPITIQYASDLHLEFPMNREFLKQYPLKPVGDILVLAGDIVPFAVMNKHKDFLSYVADHFETTYWLPGNHEYYHFDISQKSGSFCEKIKSNVFLVNDYAVQIRDMHLIFSTMWSKISAAFQWEIERGMNDFRYIKNGHFRFSTDAFNQLHETSMAFIKKEIAHKKESKMAVFTHYCPTLMHYPEQYQGSVLTEAFAVELFDVIFDSNIDYWVYGHHHSNTPAFKIGKTELLTNQLGYVQMGEHRNFVTDKVIEI